MRKIVTPISVSALRAADTGPRAGTGPGRAAAVGAERWPRREDAEQGALDDGWLVAVLGAVAGHRPDQITRSITECSAGSYLVALAETRCTASGAVPIGPVINLNITSGLPVYDHSPGEPAYAKTDHAAWPAIAEKAFAGVDGSWTSRRRAQWADNWDRLCAADAVDPQNTRPRHGRAPTGYVRLGNSGTVFDQAEALSQLTGHQAAVRHLPVRRGPIRRALHRRLSAAKPVIVTTRTGISPGEVLPYDLVAAHTYEITAVRWRTALLRNPWGYHHPKPVPLRALTHLALPTYVTLA